MPSLFEDESHARLRAQARRFASERIAPNAQRFEDEGGFPPELTKEFAATGLLGLAYPESLGGAGGDLSHLLAVQEELILEGRTVGTVVALGSHRIALPPLVRRGTPEQQARFVAPVLRGEKVAALAITEPSGGSDVARLRTRATRDGDHFVVTGEKAFITSGTRADLFTVAVRTGEEGHAGLSLMVIERDTPGLSTSPPLRKMGWHASDTALVSLEGCRVPAANLLGEAGEGFGLIVENFVEERLLLAGNCVAIAELAYREARSWTAQREAFGRPLVGFQVTRHTLAGMATRIACIRAFLDDTAQRHLRGLETLGLAAMVKNAAADLACEVTDQAVQLHGGSGYLHGTVVERLFRDARLYPIGGGAREVMNELIARTEGL